jgi:hypothetical protein
MNTYIKIGLIITEVEGDHKLACLEKDLLPIMLNIVDADNHVYKVERSIQTIEVFNNSSKAKNASFSSYCYKSS